MVLFLAVLAIIVLKRRVDSLQKENIKLAGKINWLHSLRKENNSGRTDALWHQVDPSLVAEQVYESGITNLN